jgi:glycosyltransferase involved in cell wall biosynthesis
LKTCVFLSSLINEKQRGGAYLRNKAIERIYEELGFRVVTIYREAITERKSLAQLLKGFLYGKEVRTLFSKASIDVPECEIFHVDHLRYLNWKFHFTGKKPRIIYNAHNLEFESYYARTSIDSFNAKKFKKYELEQMSKVDLTFVCSLREKNVVTTERPELEDRVFVLPNLVDKDNYVQAPINGKNYISFIGTLDYYPNIEAVYYICDQLAHVINDDDKYQLIIAGKNPTDSVRRKCQEAGIELLENLSNEEIKELFARTYVCLVPLNHGSGTRLKILEAVFSGSHVLSTPLGREGIISDDIIESDLDGFGQALGKFLKKDYSVYKASTHFCRQYDTNTWLSESKAWLIEILLN